MYFIKSNYNKQLQISGQWFLFQVTVAPKFGPTPEKWKRRKSDIITHLSNRKQSYHIWQKVAKFRQKPSKKAIPGHALRHYRALTNRARPLIILIGREKFYVVFLMKSRPKKWLKTIVIAPCNGAGTVFCMENWMSAIDDWIYVRGQSKTTFTKGSR